MITQLEHDSYAVFLEAMNWPRLAEKCRNGGCERLPAMAFLAKLREQIESGPAPMAALEFAAQHYEASPHFDTEVGDIIAKYIREGALCDEPFVRLFLHHARRVRKRRNAAL